jgi:hypothetical protein
MQGGHEAAYTFCVSYASHFCFRRYKMALQHPFSPYPSTGYTTTPEILNHFR